MHNESSPLNILSSPRRRWLATALLSTIVCLALTTTATPATAAPAPPPPTPSTATIDGADLAARAIELRHYITTLPNGRLALDRTATTKAGASPETVAALEEAIAASNALDTTPATGSKPSPGHITGPLTTTNQQCPPPRVSPAPPGVLFGFRLGWCRYAQLRLALTSAQQVLTVLAAFFPGVAREILVATAAALVLARGVITFWGDRCKAVPNTLGITVEVRYWPPGVYPGCWT